jgi:hypothetical protein
VSGRTGRCNKGRNFQEERTIVNGGLCGLEKGSWRDKVSDSLPILPKCF